MLEPQQLEQLVRQITQTVLANLQQPTRACPKLLVVDTPQQHAAIQQQVKQAGLMDLFTLQWRSVTRDQDTEYQAKSSQYLADYRSTDFLLLTALTPSDLAKGALGIVDNFVTACFSYCFQRGLPVYRLHQAFEPPTPHCQPQYAQMFSQYDRQLQTFGLRTTSWSALAATQHQQKLITAEMVRELTPNTVLTVSPKTLITPLAQELLQQKQIEIRYDAPGIQTFKVKGG